MMFRIQSVCEAEYCGAGNQIPALARIPVDSFARRLNNKLQFEKYLHHKFYFHDGWDV